MQQKSPTTRHRRLAIITAAVAAAALVAPTAAGAWPMHGQGPDHTRQATAAGPTDPGLKWLVDINDDIDGFEVNSWVDLTGGTVNNAPIVSDEDTVILRAEHTGTVESRSVASLIGLSGDDGQLAWSIDGIMPRCAPAIDSQGRLWTLLRDIDHDELDEHALQAYDPDTGEAFENTRLELDPDEVATTRVCNGAGLEVGGQGENERLVLLPSSHGSADVTAFDISGASPEVAWTEHDDDDISLYRTNHQGRALAFTEDAVLVPIAIEGDSEDEDIEQGVHLIEVPSTWDGAAETRSVRLPVADADGIEPDPPVGAAVGAVADQPHRRRRLAVLDGAGRGVDRPVGVGEDREVGPRPGLADLQLT